MATSGLDLEEEEDLGQPSGTPAAPAKEDVKKPAPVMMDEDADFGDEDQYRRPGELELLKVTEKNTFARFSVLTNPATGKAFMKKGFIHYVQGKGYARCHSKRDAKGNIVEKAFCCKLKEGEVRYSALVVCYLNIDRKTGRFEKDKPIEIELKALPLSRPGYKDVSLEPGEDEDTGEARKVMSIDLTMTPKDTAKGYTYKKISNKATWLRSPEVETAVKAAMVPFLDGQELNRKVGKNLSIPDMKAHMGIGTGGSDEGPGMDDLD